MTCSDVQRVLPDVLDGAPDGALSRLTEFEAHVQSCPDCSDLLSDLKLISSEARQLAESEEPPARVWVRIAAELRAEGLIRDSEPQTYPAARPVLVPAIPRRRRSAFWLAPVAAAVLAASAYVVSHKPVPTVAKQQASTSQVQAQLQPKPAISDVQTDNTQAAPATPSQAVAPGAPVIMAHATDRDEEAAPSAEDQQFLSVVSTAVPSMRATYESQLQAVNADIRETQAYVDRNPGDADARQHLMDAYEQKALLYQIALDRIQ